MPGITVAGGVFIPSLLTGAAMGRIFGQLLNAGPLEGHVVDAGVYAFLGTRD
jgi:H+/Cl- antiporter ClcA